MKRRDLDHRRYQRNKTRKKINQRIFEEKMETSEIYEPTPIRIGNRTLTKLEAKDNTEVRFRAEMHNRTQALTKKIEYDGLDYTRLTITFPTANRTENNFFGSPVYTDKYLHMQKDSIRHFIESVVRRYERTTGKKLMYKYNIEVQLKTGVNLHAHAIFYHEWDTANTIKLCSVISELRYDIKNKKINKKKEPVRILGVGRLYVQMHIYHDREVIRQLKLSSEGEIYAQLRMTKAIDSKAKNYACLESNTDRKNFLTGSWVWFSFLDTDDMAEMHAEHDQYDNKANLTHTHTELLSHIEHDTKALIQDDSKLDSGLTAEFIVDNIKNDFCKNYVNNAILEDLNIRRVTTSLNLLFPINVYRRCREQLIKYDERHSEIYFTTTQLENKEIFIEKNVLYTQVINTKSGEIIAQFNTKKRSA